MFGIGDTVKVVDRFRLSRGLPDSQVITGQHDGRYWELDGNDLKGSGWTDNELILLKKKEDTMDNLESGTRVFNERGEERQVIGYYTKSDEKYMVAIDLYDGTYDSGTYSMREVENWTTKGPVKEYTLEQIAYELDIPVKQLRIKD